MSVLLINGNALQIPLADNSVHCVVTSPPYWSLRDYGVDGQLGLEQTPEEYVANMVAVFREVRRVLRDDGTCWVNLGDSYYANPAGKPSQKYVVDESVGDGVYGRRWRNNHQGGYDIDTDARRTTGNKIDNLKPKDMVGIPWRVAFALQADGWWLRSDIIWSKPNPMPESVTDRPTKAHEYVFLLSKSQRYYYDADAVRENSIDKESINGRRSLRNDYSLGLIDPDGYGQTRTGFKNIPLGKTYPQRNRRTVWEIATAPYSGAHFATYPPALVEPCIKAGTSERGVCPVCGAGWRRVVEREIPPDDVYTAGKLDGNKNNRGWKQAGQKLTDWRNEHPNTLSGWQPTCNCPPHDPIPATVFDPFAGSGTTLMVARKLGRHGVGLDLSLRYLVENARQRLELDRLDAWGSDGKKDGKVIDDLPLFQL